MKDCTAPLCIECLSTSMKGSVTFDHIPTGNLRGTDKTEKADELKEFANLMGASCPSGENYIYNRFLKKFIRIRLFNR